MAEPVKAEAALRRVLGEAERRGYRWLAGRALYSLADLQGSLHHYSRAIGDSRRALALAEAVGDRKLEVRCLTQLAEWHQEAGEFGEALGHLMKGMDLERLGALGPDEGWGLYTAGGLNHEASGNHAAALDFHREALRLADESGTRLQLARSHSYIALSLSRLGRYTEAVRSLQRAAEAGRELGDEAVRQGVEEQVALRLGDIARERGDYAQAVTHYSRALEIGRRLDYPVEVYSAWKGLLLADLAAGNYAAARRDFNETLRLFELYRARITQEELRTSFRDLEQGVHDLAIRYEYTVEGDHRRAFDLSETARARSLLDLLRSPLKAAGRGGRAEGRVEVAEGAIARPLTLTEIRRRMPEGTQLLQYAVLEDRLIAWLVTRESMRTYERVIPETLLDDRVRALNELFRRGRSARAEARAQAAELYDLLVGPLAAGLSRERELCVVPDKVLNHVPFAALVVRETGGFLAEQFPITVAPSASIFVLNSEAAAGKRRADLETVLSVGNPHFRAEDFPQLSPLPDAAREAEQVAAGYRASKLLVGEGATEAEVKRLLGSFGVIHFAAHSLSNDRAPLLSGLVLAPGGAGEDDGRFRAREICRTRLDRAGLVVLSACQSGVERASSGEGMIGLARAFMVAGVPLVVASLWPVESDFTADLMINFHRLRREQGLSTARALQAAQRAMLGRHDVEPYQWAAFTVIGGHTKY